MDGPVTYAQFCLRERLETFFSTISNKAFANSRKRRSEEVVNIPLSFGFPLCSLILRMFTAAVFVVLLVPGQFVFTSERQRSRVRTSVGVIQSYSAKPTAEKCLRRTKLVARERTRRFQFRTDFRNCESETRDNL